MSSNGIVELTALGAAPATNDLLVVDLHSGSQASTGARLSDTPLCQRLLFPIAAPSLAITAFASSLSDTRHPIRVRFGEWVSAFALCSFTVHIPASAGAALCSAISQILALCAKKEVVRIDAHPDITSVQDEQSVWNRAVGEFPSHPMCQMAIVVAPVSGSVRGTKPQNASSVRIKPRPFRHLLRWRHYELSHAAEYNSLSLVTT